MATELTPAPIGPESRVDAGIARQRTSTVATLVDGGFVVAWENEPSTTGSVDVFAQRYAADGTAVGGKFTVNTTIRDIQQSATVTGLADGGFLVAWYGYSQPAGFALGNFAQRFAADGARVGGEFALGGSEVVGLADGGFLAIATRFNHAGADSGYDVYARRHAADGAPLGGEFRVNPTVAGGQWNPAVATLADGDFVVSWETQGTSDPGAADIYAQRYAADGAPLGGEFRVNTRVTGLQEAPAVTGLSDGGFVVSWAGPNPTLTGRDIHAQRYAADGSPAGGEFRVHEATAKEEFSPAIAASANNGFVVSWESGAWWRREASEIRLQRFDAPASGVAVGITAAEPSKAEGDAGSTAFAFTVGLGAPATATESVGWRVASFGANPAGAADFAGGALPSGTLVFVPGETSKTVTVLVAGDTGAEADEGFRVFLSDPSPGLSLGGPGVVATVYGDDLPPIGGTAGDDLFVHAPGRHGYEGFGGRDALDLGSRGLRRAEVATLADGGALLAHGGDRAVLRGVEEARFADGRLVFDADDAAARVLRLYEAALDRLPDQGGLNFWIDAVRSGQPLSTLASGFLGSGEFRARFGGDAADDGAFVDRLYLNVLGRPGEPEGRQYWTDVLGGGAAGRAQVLAAFSESAENKAGTAALVQAGIWDRSEAAMEVGRLYDTESP